MSSSKASRKEKKRAAAAAKSAAVPSTTVGQVITVDLPTLDSLDAEAVAVFLWSDVRPLKGVAGFIDWRVCGGLSRLLAQQLFTGRRGETLLYPVRGRFGPRRLFLFGLGCLSQTDQESLQRACRQAYEVLNKAGVARIVYSAPFAVARSDSQTSFLKALATELPSRVDHVLVTRR